MKKDMTVIFSRPKYHPVDQPMAQFFRRLAISTLGVLLSNLLLRLLAKYMAINEAVSALTFKVADFLLTLFFLAFLACLLLILFTKGISGLPLYWAVGPNPDAPARKVTMQITRTGFEIRFAESFTLFKTPWSKVPSQANYTVSIPLAAISWTHLKRSLNTGGLMLLTICADPECTKTVAGVCESLTSAQKRRLLDLSGHRLYIWLNENNSSELKKALKHFPTKNHLDERKS